MSKYKLIALDIDGTLLNSELKLTEGNRQAIHRAAAAGKHIVLSTGRCLPELRDILAQLPEIRYLVCENGSCVYDLKYEHSIHVSPVPKEEILFILNLLKKERRVLQVFHDNRPYFDQSDDRWADAYRVGNYRAIFNQTGFWDVRLFDRYEERPFQIEKINLYFENARTRDRIHQALEGRRLKLANSIGYMIEAVAGDADKGEGLKRLCDHLKISIEDTIAVGDSPNDVEILQAAGFSAAMANAWPEAKAAADFITDDCDHDGVAKVIYEYLLKD